MKVTARCLVLLLLPCACGTWLAVAAWLEGFDAPAHLAGTVATVPAFFLPLSLGWKLFRLRADGSPRSRWTLVAVVVGLWYAVFLGALFGATDGLGPRIRDRWTGMVRGAAAAGEQGAVERYLRGTEEWPDEGR